MRILIDCDNVLNNLTEAVLSVYNEDYKDNLTINDITCYHIENFVKPGVKENFYHYFTDKRVWKRVKPVEEAKPVLRELRSRGHELYVCTSTEPANAFKKSKWCEREFYFNHRKEFIMCHNKSLVNADILIDDCLDNFGGQQYSICIDYPWNKGMPQELLYTNKNFYRAHDWEEVLKKVMAIEERQRLSEIKPYVNNNVNPLGTLRMIDGTIPSTFN